MTAGLALVAGGGAHLLTGGIGWALVTAGVVYLLGAWTRPTVEDVMPLTPDEIPAAATE
jgi:hypothetical protein